VGRVMCTAALKRLEVYIVPIEMQL